MPDVEEVRPGVWSIPVLFPRNPLRYTLSYLLLGTAGAVLVDPGWDSDEGWQQLLAGLEHVGLPVEDLTGIVVSHFHPDHLGMAARLKAASGAWIGLGSKEGLQRGNVDRPEDFAAADLAKFARWGVPEPKLAEVTFSAAAWAATSASHEPDLRFDDGDYLPLDGTRIQVLFTPGHTPGHICLWDEKNSLLLTGDHVLPRITPHISLESFGAPNPLQEYYESLARVDLPAEPDEIEVLPGHEYRFSGLHERIAEIVAHTDQRSAEVRRVLSNNNPANVWEVARSLTWSRGWESLAGFTLRLALAETASHLVYLRSRGVAVNMEALEADGRG